MHNSAEVLPEMIEDGIRVLVYVSALQNLLVILLIIFVIFRPARRTLCAITYVFQDGGFNLTNMNFFFRLGTPANLRGH